MNILLSNPRGFCAGVDRAIEIVERALDRLGAPIYVRHEVVHNRYVVNGLKEKGAIFTDDIAEIPEGSSVIFSAHGVSQQVRLEAKARNLTVFDATCPLVTKVHIEVQKYYQENYEVILIGHAGHPEVEGTLGQFADPKRIYLLESVAAVSNLQIQNIEKLAYVTQTTLSMDDTSKIIDALRQRFPHIVGPAKDDICYATQNRQDAVKKLAVQCQLVLVVGSANSSNSNRLKELAKNLGTPAYLIDDETAIDPQWFQALSAQDSVGITAGASAPEVLVDNVINKLQSLYSGQVIEVKGVEEKLSFSLPKSLR